MTALLYIIIALLCLAVAICLIFICALLTFCIVFGLAYLFIFLRVRKKREVSSALFCDYAHRGLHSASIPENSLAAFDLAAERGYGIELDVQLSKDGEVMVFHDYTLERMTGRDEKLCELDANELCALSLAGTQEKIPTLAQVLDLVDARVPILVELKGENKDTSLCAKTAELLRTYKGVYCIESFNPLLVKEMKKQLPDVFAGLLYTNVCKDRKKYSPLNIAISTMSLNFIAYPDFIAYNKEYRNSFAVKLVNALYKPYRTVWTIKSEDELELAHSLGEAAIFEQIDSILESK